MCARETRALRTSCTDESKETKLSTAPAPEARLIQTKAPPARFARGWHCLGIADSFRDGKPHAVQAFSTKLVVFADSKGALSVLNGYCPHMGGDLTMGTVKGDAIACPFHDWRWGGDGKCAGIPYSKRVPPRARTRAWTTLERNGQLFVWNDPQGNPPPADVTIPEIAAYRDPEWTEWTWDSVVIEGSNCREIVDNVVDMAHFFYVHYSFPTYFKNVLEGHTASQVMTSTSREDVMLFAGRKPGTSTSHSDAAYYGPSYMIDYLKSESPTHTMDAVLINCHYPVTPTSFVLQWGIMVKKSTGMSDEMANAVAASIADGVAVGFKQDVEIWQNKTKIENPLLCEEDGPIYQLRRWYEQFYVDVEDVTEQMVERFEFEIDTNRAVQFWKDEVAENVATGNLLKAAPDGSMVTVDSFEDA